MWYFSIMMFTVIPVIYYIILFSTNSKQIPCCDSWQHQICNDISYCIATRDGSGINPTASVSSDFRLSSCAYLCSLCYWKDIGHENLWWKCHVSIRNWNIVNFSCPVWQWTWHNIACLYIIFGNCSAIC